MSWPFFGHTSPPPAPLLLQTPLATSVAPTIPTGPWVLLVEDNAVNQMVGLTILKKLGYMVDAVDSGEAALAALLQRRYVLILMDVQMPGMDGYQATQEIRAGACGMNDPQIPIIAITANVLPEDRSACLAAGMDDFVAKPVRRNELMACLARWVPIPVTSTPEVAHTDV